MSEQPHDKDERGRRIVEAVKFLKYWQGHPEFWKFVEEQLSIFSRESFVPELGALPSQEHVAWCRFKNWPNGSTSIHLCDSDTPGAFKVYRAPLSTTRTLPVEVSQEQTETVMVCYEHGLFKCAECSAKGLKERPFPAPRSATGAIPK